MKYTDPYKVEFKYDEWLVMDVGKLSQQSGVDAFAPTEYTADQGNNEERAVAPQSAECYNHTLYDDDEYPYKKYAEQFTMLENLTRDVYDRRKRRWLGLHRPIFGLLNSDPGHGSYLQNFDCELAVSAALSNVSIDDIFAVVSGHLHAHQHVAFGDFGFPTQLIFGNGGTQLATPRNGAAFGTELASGRNILGTDISSAETIGEFGFGVIQVGQDFTRAGVSPKYLKDTLGSTSRHHRRRRTMRLMPKRFRITKTYSEFA